MAANNRDTVVIKQVPAGAPTAARKAPIPSRQVSLEWPEAAARALGQLREGLLRQTTEIAELRAERDRLRQELAEARAHLAAAQAELDRRETFVAHTLELTSLVRMFELSQPADAQASQPATTSTTSPEEVAAPTAPPGDREAPAAPSVAETTMLVWPGTAAAPDAAAHPLPERLPQTGKLRVLPGFAPTPSSSSPPASPPSPRVTGS